MKKVLKIMILLLVFSMGKAKAETFFEDNYVDSYATYIKDDFTKSQHMRFIRRVGDNLPIYCLTPDKLLYEDEVYNARIYSQEEYLNITTEKYKRISEIAYFGYNYKDHKEDKWYAITQMMLWREMDPDATIYFTDKFKGNRITKYTDEEEQIEKLIKNYHILPNINDLNLSYNKEYKIKDSNNILNEYEIEKNDLDIKIENNTLKINTNKKGIYKIKLIRKDGNHSHMTIPYTAKKGQDLLIRGYIDRPYKEININITGSNLELKKIDSETLNSNKRGNATLKNAIYELYDTNGNLIDTLTTNENGIAKLENIQYGNYYLKEIKAPIGYKLDNKIYNLKIDKENEFITLKEDIIRANLILNKYLKDDKNLKEEKNISFSIYDMNNKLIDKITTNESGQAKINLIYGKYKVVQENTTLGYKKVKDFYIEINSSDDKIFNIEDDRVNINLKINKKDFDSKKNIILSKASFKIKDLSTNLYIKNNGTDIFTTNNGVLSINIKGGKYLLEEVSAPKGYIIESFKEFIVDEEKEIEIDIYNKKQYGKIKIIKYGKLLNNKYKYLKNVKFNIYAYDDILSDDNTLYYKKDELVDTIVTDETGTILSKPLIIGKYYIKEVSTQENFIIDKNKYIIDFTNNLNIGTVIKEITIVNKEINNIYPKTNNKDIYINTFISYLSLFGIILIISSLKNEKIRNIFTNIKFYIIRNKKRNRKE